MFEARNFVDYYERETEGLSREEIDKLEPWCWCDTSGNELLIDDGENLTYELAEGQYVRWLNSERKWYVVYKPELEELLGYSLDDEEEDDDE